MSCAEVDVGGMSPPRPVRTCPGQRPAPRPEPVDKKEIGQRELDTWWAFVAGGRW